MDTEVKNILNKIISFDIIIAIIVGILSSIIFKSYTYMIIIGLLMAALNLILNSIITTYAFKDKVNRVLGPLGSVVRIILTASIVILICKNNRFNFVAFFIGYTLHYISIVFYGITIKNQKGSD
ncbi:ATP synthase subunit I [Clostridium sp.]|jgi:ATP synthase protein I|uniref:ATP synthase subunit I n=1 Tax=Clostridium sp. TaxID=1506 RepID=UPI002590D1B5|nr:ATP synthase subunit I [Clostridium sp.]MDF2503799.1 synthase chain [Clostridium sp.]